MRKPSTILLRILVVLLVSGFAWIAAASSVMADAVYHSQHIDLAPVDGAPLKSGFVENIHVNGPQIYAQERYVLNGASPNTAYQVTLLIYPFDTSCTAEPAPVTLPTANFRTNLQGNGVGRAVFTPADVPEMWRTATHGLRWQLWANESVRYETACAAVTLD